MADNTVVKAFGDLITSTIPNRKKGNKGVYAALLTQVGVGAPIAVVNENTLGDIVWSYISVGVYMATLTGAFKQGITSVDVSSKTGVSALVISANQVRVNAPADGDLVNQLITIKNY